MKTIDNIMFYINLYNRKAAKLKLKAIDLDIANGGYKLIIKDSHNDVSFRLTKTQIYNIVYAMYQAIEG